MPPGGPQNNSVNDQYRIPPPKSIKEVPGYLKEVISAFFGRMLYIVKLVWEVSPGILFLMAFMALWSGVMPVVGSLIGKELLNKLAQAYNGQITEFKVIMALLVLQFAYLLVNMVFNRLDNTLIRIAGEMVSNHIKLKIMGKAREVDLASFDSPDFYAKMENANREAGTRPIQVLRSTFSIISAVISIISFLIVIIAVGLVPVLLVVIVSIPATIINFVYRKKNHQYVFKSSKDRRQMNYYSDVIVNKDLVKEVRMLGLTDTFIGRYKEVFMKYFGGLKKLILQEFFWNLGAAILSTAVNCVLFVYIARGVFTGDYQIGDYSLYTGALNSIASGISTLITTTASIYEGTLFINNMIAFMKEEPHIVSSLDKPRPVNRGKGHTIVFEDVSFRYPGTERNVINHVNLTIHPGETIVMVGLNGAGKTTLIKLLTRLYDPTEGRILFDGYDIKEYDPKELYSIFGIVFQDYGKYAVSVRDNIRFGEIDMETNEQRVYDAAEQSNASAFIDALPDKFDTPLMRYFEDNGIELSIGQWQKLAIARAFYADSDILILDEPTASLDPIAEQEIFNQFDELRADKASIFVSHRLSSATTADTIIVLKDGALIEYGSHAELMAKKGEYYTLFYTQAKRYITSADESVNSGEQPREHGPSEKPRFE